MTGPACLGGAHTGPHRLDWHDLIGGTDRRVLDVVEVAVHHADPDVAQADVAAVVELAARFRRGPGRVDVTDDELAAVGRVIGSACEYMTANGYADDGDFPDDRFAAQVLGEHGTLALICWAGR